MKRAYYDVIKYKINDEEDYIKYNRYLVNLSFSISNTILETAVSNKSNNNKDRVRFNNYTSKN